MAIILECNTVEELRNQILKYLAHVEITERHAAISERTVSASKARNARANLAQTLQMELREALLHQKDDQ